MANGGHIEFLKTHGGEIWGIFILNSGHIQATLLKFLSNFFRLKTDYKQKSIHVNFYKN